MGQMQLQQEQAIKETFKEHLLKQASDATGVNISVLRQPPNAETQINRINTMLRPTQFTDESFEAFHQDTQVFTISDDGYNCTC